VGGATKDSSSSKKNENQKALPRAKERIKILEGTVRRISQENEQLERENKKIKNENERLKKELSAIRKPPRWVKPNKDKGAKRRKKKLGPKKGHKPSPRKVPEKVDEQVTWIPLICSECDTGLPEPHKWHNHYQIDIPPIAESTTTEHIVGWSWCSICNKAVSVSNKLGSSLYGPRLHAMVVDLKYSLGLTLGKIHNLILDQYGLNISTGVISEMLTRTAEKFRSGYDDIKSRLSDEPHIHADETGWRCGGNNHWLWSFSSDEISFYEINRHRSQEVVEKILGKSYSGVLISDFYGAYNKTDCQKQKCWPHLLRDLHEQKEKYPNSQEIKAFAKKAKQFFEWGKKLQVDFKDGKGIESRLKRLLSKTEQWIFRKYRHKELKRLCKRLIKYRDELYTFIKTGVDPTNNNGEREIRPAVLMRKISYCNRSDQGKENQAILMTMARTSAKKEQNFVNMATDYLKGNVSRSYWMNEVSSLNYLKQSVQV